MVLLPPIVRETRHDESSLASLALPPPCFQEVRSVDWAERKSNPPHFGIEARPTAAQAAGLRYERKAQAFLRENLPRYEIGPWFAFGERGRVSYCQPDGVMWDGSSGTAWIFEIKYRWCVEGWWQLTRKYGPVVGAALRTSRVCYVGVCRSCDLDGTPTPTRPCIAADLERATAPPSNAEGKEAVRILLWKPPRRK
jgi:hypothetical protein